MFVYTINDILGLIVIALVVAVAFAINAITLFKQWRCKHDGGVNEDQACDAWCRKCGKNLGFIGSWHKKEVSKNG